MAVLRIDDQGALSIAWQSEPKPKRAIDYRLVDLDNDGDPELHARARGEAGVSFKANSSGRFEPWDHPLAGNFEGAVAEVCQWFQEQTKAAGCDPLLDLSSSTCFGPGGTVLLVQAPGDWRKSTDFSAAFLVDQGHARLLRAMHGGLGFSKGRPVCFVRHQLSTWFDSEEKLCLRDGALAPE